MSFVSGVPEGLILDLLPERGFASVCIAFTGPEFWEAPGQLGYSALLMDYIRSGAGVVSDIEVAEKFGGWGGGLSSFCGDVVCGLRFSVRPEVVCDSLAFLSQLLVSIIEDPGLLDRERNVRTSLIQEERDDPSSKAFRQMRQYLLAGSSLADSPDGREEDLQQVSFCQLKSLGERIIRRGHTAMAISGEFDVESVCRIVGRHFSLGRRENKTPFLNNDRSHVGSLDRREEHDRAQAIVVHALRTGPETDGIQSLLGRLALASLNGLSGPLFEEIRESHGLAYFCYARQVVGLSAGVFGVVAGCERNQTEFLVDQLQSVFRRLSREGFTPDEMAAGKAMVLSGLRINRQRASWRSYRLATRAVIGWQSDLGENEEVQLKEISLDTLKVWTEEEWGQKQFSTLRLLPESVD
ncbi:MAG: insulinase family protein [Verrucomicrobiota bacterium]